MRLIIHVQITTVGGAVLDKAIGIGDEQAPRLEWHRLLLPGATEGTHQGACPRAHVGVLVDRDDHRRMMASVGVGDRVRCRIHHSDEGRHKVFIRRHGVQREREGSAGRAPFDQGHTQQIPGTEGCQDRTRPMTGRISDHECQPIIGQGNRIPPIAGENPSAVAEIPATSHPATDPCTGDLIRDCMAATSGASCMSPSRAAVASSISATKVLRRFSASARHRLKFWWSDRLDRGECGVREQNGAGHVRMERKGFDDPLIQRHRRVGNEEGDNRRENEEPYAELRHRTPTPSLCASSIALVFTSSRISQRRRSWSP